MKYLLLILTFLSLQASGQIIGAGAVFHAHNRNVASAPPDPVASIDMLRLWYMANAGVNTSGGVVTSWDNQAGGDPMVPYSAGGATGPTPEPYNGFAALRFNGTNTALVAPDLSGAGDQNTLFIVFKRNSTAFQMLATTASVPAQYIATYDPGLYQLTSPSGTSGNALACITIVTNSTVWDAYVNNVYSLTTNFQTAIWSGLLVGRWSGGTPYWWDGWVMEIIYYDKILSEPERTVVHDYLKAKYNLP